MLSASAFALNWKKLPKAHEVARAPPPWHDDWTATQEMT